MMVKLLWLVKTICVYFKISSDLRNNLTKLVEINQVCFKYKWVSVKQYQCKKLKSCVEMFYTQVVLAHSICL